MNLLLLLDILLIMIAYNIEIYYLSEENDDLSDR